VGADVAADAVGAEVAAAEVAEVAAVEPVAAASEATPLLGNNAASEGWLGWSGRMVGQGIGYAGRAGVTVVRTGASWAYNAVSSVGTGIVEANPELATAASAVSNAATAVADGAASLGNQAVSAASTLVRFSFAARGAVIGAGAGLTVGGALGGALYKDN